MINNNNKPLDDNLFKNPTREYKSAPFWAWNSKLDKDELKRQIDILKEMGYGGYHMHVRTGMATKYLSKDFFDNIKTCINHGKDVSMLSYLYDEDRWPSGTAGGFVTTNDEFKETNLLFTKKVNKDLKLFGIYDINLNNKGYITSYKLVNSEQGSNIWYAYIFKSKESSWYNNHSYVDTLSKDAMDSFIDITYNKYYEEIGDEFNKNVPSIFTDEPHFRTKDLFDSSFSESDLCIPWTKNLETEYSNKLNYSIKEKLPLLFYVKEDEEDKLIKYNFNILLSELFNKAYFNNIGNFCKNHNINFTGHLYEEPTLLKQALNTEDAMYQYKDMDMPGVDMLQRKMEFTTLKQASSVVNQFNKKDMLSELYGVTSYEFDFRDYKLHGDFEAALGVTLRVPHLSWYSMNGEAKRDYPASYNYQAPWYKELPYIENHFSRLNTVLKRGKRIVKIGIVSPIESMYINLGPNDLTKEKRLELDNNFNTLTNKLLFNQLDFDYISESLLSEIKDGSNVYSSSYDCIILPFMETIRSTTISFLERCLNDKKEVIIFGDEPRLVDAIKSNEFNLIKDRCTKLSLNYSNLIDNLEKYREVSIKDLNGNCFNLIYQLRDDVDCKWLFISHAIEVRNKDISIFYDTHIKVKGLFKASLYDTMTGDIKKVNHYTKDGYTYIEISKLYEFDSLLFKLVEVTSSNCEIISSSFNYDNDINLPNEVKYELDEDNVLVLDRCKLVLDDIKEFKEQEILKQDDLLREYLGFEKRKKEVCQPWAFNEELKHHKVELIFNFKSEIESNNLYLALEEIDKTTIILNNNIQDKTTYGYYTDKCLSKIKLDKINIGINTLKLIVDFDQLTDLENIFILGKFGVKLNGKYGIIKELKDTIEFGDITLYDLPFYSGNITYIVPIETDDSNILVHSNYYKGSLLKVSLDDSELEYITLPPYNKEYRNIKPGKHILKLKLFTHRENTFGPLHLMDYKQMPSSPSTFRTEGEKWSDEIIVRPVGLLKAPIIKGGK